MASSLLSSAASVASALAPIVSQYMSGKSRSARRRRNKRGNRASSGQRGPSATSAPRGRPSARGSRRRRNPNSSSGASSSLVKQTSTMRTLMPATVSYRSNKTFYRQSGRPVHKEWGEGIRFVGCSILGSMQVTSSVFTCYQNAVAQTVGVVDDSLAATRYYDLYVAASIANEDTIMALHPALIERLQQECLNWGRYCFRSLKVHSSPQAPTNDVSGWVAGVTHDTAWPLDIDQLTFGANDIAVLGTHDNGAFYEPFDLSLNDFKGDRTWATTLPVLDIITGSADGPPSSFLWPYCDASYQHLFCILRPDDGASTTQGFRGYVYVTYEIDFYSVRADSTSLMNPIVWNGGLTTTTSGSKYRFGSALPKRRRTARLIRQPTVSSSDKKEDPVTSVMAKLSLSDVKVAPKSQLVTSPEDNDSREYEKEFPELSAPKVERTIVLKKPFVSR